MRVADAMSEIVLSIGPAHTLRQASALMARRRVGSAVVVDPDAVGHGILTERDILNAIGAGLDPDVEHAAAHLTSDLVYAGPDWTLLKAAEAMLRGGFRHLIVMDDSTPVGILSVRDIVRAWAHQQAPAQV
ncbi:CBS domain-containing protein [Natronoglycomyces albus]|uniref:CBS domain-containing protein n=1 Tax=Natronoglycomyces albus TaxID=2811108 RepID=A0A895XNQ8_9ACTN|nr:CBS domain-containing protein [Natronoglycomyces albus]QSB05019.1 CBS domain-containing protein [Natronoglycomyces albus]